MADGIAEASSLQIAVGHAGVGQRAVGDPLMDVYVAIDAAIGCMLQDADRESFVLVTSCTGVRAGRVEPVSILDFVPTLAALSGVGLPESDGRPIEALTGPLRDPAAG